MDLIPYKIHRLKKIDVITAINAAQSTSFVADPTIIGGSTYDKLLGKLTIDIIETETETGFEGSLIEITKAEIAQYTTAYIDGTVEAATIKDIQDDGDFYKVII